MKRTVKVNINGFVFNMDEDAFRMLEDYLNDIERKFMDAEGGSEIIADIEARVAELLQDKTMKGVYVVSESHISEIIEILGSPDDFTDDEVGDAPFEGPYAQEETHKQKRTKQIYRDPDNSVVSGLCGGIGAYFKIDPLYIRIAFVALTIFGIGAIALLYIVLWIIVPPAITTAQKLEMHGEKVNISNIERKIKEEFDGVKNNFKNFRYSREYERTTSFLGRFLGAIVSVVGWVFKFIGSIIGIALVFAGLVVIMALVGSVFFGLDVIGQPEFIEEFHFMPIITELLGGTSSLAFSAFGVILIVGVPIALLVFLGLKMAFRFRSNNGLIVVSGIGLWILGLIILGGFVGTKVLDFKREGQITETKVIDFDEDTLRLKLFDENISNLTNNPDNINFEDYKILETDGEFRVYGIPKFTIEKNQGNDIALHIVKTARGSKSSRAHDNAKKMDYNWEYKDGTLFFDNHFAIHQGEWKKQELALVLSIPENTIVKLDGSMEGIIDYIDNVNNYWDFEMLNKAWIMKREGLTLVNGHEEKHISKDKEGFKSEDDIKTQIEDLEDISIDFQ